MRMQRLPDVAVAQDVEVLGFEERGDAEKSIRVDHHRAEDGFFGFLAVRGKLPRAWLMVGSTSAFRLEETKRRATSRSAVETGLYPLWMRTASLSCRAYP